jgi:glycosyltransferase involved in cell wall biosynthesis
MKILLVTATYTPSVNGVAIVVENIKRSLESEGHQVFVLAPNNRKKIKDEANVIRYPSLENPVSDDYPIPLFPGVKAIYKLIETKGFDLVHVHHPFHVGYFARLIARKYKIPLVFTYHTNYDEYSEKYLEFLPKKLKRQFIENTVYKFCEKSDLVISPSEHITKKLSGEMPYLRMVTIPSSISAIERLNISKLKLRINLGLPKNKKILLSVNRLSPEKDTDLMIHSLKHLSERYVLVLVGDGPERKRLEKLTEKLNLVERVLFVGRIPHQKVGEYYHCADAFYFASKTETQGLIFLEAISMGLPIVAVSSDASREWVKPGFGVITINDPRTLAEGVSKLFKKNQEKLRESAIVYSKNFTKDIMTQKLIKNYKKVINDKKTADKILSTGWQSWSPSRRKMLNIPIK